MLYTHKMELPDYHLVCGKIHGDNPIFQLGHGGSIYWSHVDCPDCKRIGGMECEDEGCEHYGTPHSHPKE